MHVRVRVGGSLWCVCVCVSAAEGHCRLSAECFVEDANDALLPLPLLLLQSPHSSLLHAARGPNNMPTSHSQINSRQGDGCFVRLSERTPSGAAAAAATVHLKVSAAAAVLYVTSSSAAAVWKQVCFPSPPPLPRWVGL